MSSKEFKMLYKPTYEDDLMFRMRELEAQLCLSILLWKLKLRGAKHPFLSSSV